MAIPEGERVRATAPVLQMVGSEHPISMSTAALERRCPARQPACCVQKWPWWASATAYGDTASAGDHLGFWLGATELARGCCICIIPDSRPVSLLSNPTVVVSIYPTYFAEPAQMLFKVFANTLLSHCRYSVFNSASNYNDDNPARLPAESVEPGERKKLQLTAFGW